VYLTAWRLSQDALAGVREAHARLVPDDRHCSIFIPHLRSSENARSAVFRGLRSSVAILVHPDERERPRQHSRRIMTDLFRRIALISGGSPLRALYYRAGESTHFTRDLKNAAWPSRALPPPLSTWIAYPISLLPRASLPVSRSLVLHLPKRSLCPLVFILLHLQNPPRISHLPLRGRPDSRGSIMPVVSSG